MLTILLAILMTLATAAILLQLRDSERIINMPIRILLSVTGFSAITFAVMACISFMKRTSYIDIKDIANIAENLKTETVLWTDDYSLVYLNKKMRDLLGVSRDDIDPRQVIGNIFNVKYFTADEITPLLENANDEYIFKDADGCTQSIIWSTSRVKQGKKCTLYMSSGFNYTELKRIQDELIEANNRYDLSMALAEIGILTGQTGTGYTASAETVSMLGLNSDRLSFEEFSLLIHPNDRSTYEGYFRRLTDPEYDSNEIVSIEMRVKSRDGAYRWYAYRFRAIKHYLSYDNIIGGAFLDINSEREKDRLIEKLAFVDEITGISNRNKLLKIGQETYEGCARLGYTYWVIVLDIDKFHIINDTCGYYEGNKLLKNFAESLFKHIRLGGVVARVGGDNFAVVVRNYIDDGLPKRIIESIQQDFAGLAKDSLSSQLLTCSAGYSKMPDDGVSFLDVLEHAEFALKSVGDARNTVTAYENRMHDEIIGGAELEKELADAIDNKELVLYYQPKSDLRTGAIVGVEALVRWIKPDGTVVSPGLFVPVAERSQLIDRISDFVLNEACKQNMLWKRMGYPDIVMSVNFSSSDFYKSDLRNRVFESLASSGLQAEWLEIELTESLALSDVDYAILQMEGLRSLGVQLAMDDFGTGYSSLSYIQLLPITLLKLDQSFIVNIENDNVAFEIVSAVIRIAKSKGIKVIAEGIETVSQAEILKNAGCDYGQGYLYGKPMPPERIHKYFEGSMNRKAGRA